MFELSDKRCETLIRNLIRLNKDYMYLSELFGWVVQGVVNFGKNINRRIVE